jgi:hypothetical protein
MAYNFLARYHDQAFLLPRDPSSLCQPKNMLDERHAVNLLADAWPE